MENKRIPQFQEVKKGDVKKLDLPGIKIGTIDFDTTDEPVSITIEATDGRILRVTGSTSYSTRIHLFTDKPAETETTYLLTGELGPEVFHDEAFKTRDKAEEKMKQLTANFQNARNLIITEKRVEV